MKGLYKNVKSKIASKKGASNLEVIIVMAIALVIGGALFIVGNNLTDAAKSAQNKSDGMKAAIEGSDFTTLKN